VPLPLALLAGSPRQLEVDTPPSAMATSDRAERRPLVQQAEEEPRRQRSSSIKRDQEREDRGVLALLGPNVPLRDEMHGGDIGGGGAAQPAPLRSHRKLPLID
jgi:hypothetical protein